MEPCSISLWLMIFTYPLPYLFFRKDLTEFEPAKAQLSSSAFSGISGRRQLLSSGARCKMARACVLLLVKTVGKKQQQLQWHKSLVRRLTFVGCVPKGLCLVLDILILMSSDRCRKLPHDSAKVCGSCRFLRRPVYYSSRLVEACEKVGKAGNICTENLGELIYEVLTLYRERFWCSSEECWTHLLDYCSLWQLRQREAREDFIQEGCGQ